MKVSRPSSKSGSRNSLAAEPTGEPTPVWVLVDPRAGTANQALGVADRLDLPVRKVPLSYGALARLPNFGPSLRALTGEARKLITPPWPSAVIAAGRRSAAVARYIRRQSPETKLFQIMYPGGGLDAFDLVAIPEHDAPPKRANVMTVTGAPHRLSRMVLDEAGQDWRDRFEGMPRPWIAVMVGGATKRKPFPAAVAARLAREAAELAEQTGGSLLVSTSRRTGDAAEAFEGLSSSNSYLYRVDDGAENPYRGILGLADAVVVTGDSVSMVCEACATGVPVWIFSPPGFAVAKHEELHRRLYDLGAARPFTGNWDSWKPAVLDESGRIAAAIKQKLGMEDR